MVAEIGGEGLPLHTIKHGNPTFRKCTSIDPYMLLLQKHNVSSALHFQLNQYLVFSEVGVSAPHHITVIYSTTFQIGESMPNSGGHSPQEVGVVLINYILQDTNTKMSDSKNV